MNTDYKLDEQEFHPTKQVINGEPETGGGIRTAGQLGSGSSGWVGFYTAFNWPFRSGVEMALPGRTVGVHCGER